MTLHCDHCRGNLDRSAQRYWRMRFCSQACKQAYQRRLDQSTRDKIGRLDRVAPHAPQAMGRLVASRSFAGFGRHFAG
jgi:hypothetical protein